MKGGISIFQLDLWPDVPLSRRGCKVESRESEINEFQGTHFENASNSDNPLSGSELLIWPICSA